MSIPLLPEFDADGYQVEPTTAKINELVAATNTATGAAISLLPEFDTDGQQVEPSTAKLNEIITALNDNGGATIDLLPTFAANGYEYLPSTATFNGVITAVNEYEPPVTDPELLSVAVSGNYPSAIALPSGIQSGDLLLALVQWEQETSGAVSGFTSIESAGSEWSFQVSQYRIADGNEGAEITDFPSFAVGRAIVVRISGVNAADPINVAGAPERQGGASAASKTVELDSISPDIENAALMTLAIGDGGDIPTGLTIEGENPDLTDSDTSTLGGASLELLVASGATGTRTCVSIGPGSNAYGVMAALIALNPA